MDNSEPESKRPIEGVLEAYARKRREGTGGDFPLHPATRNLLQAEVSRTFGAVNARRKTGFGLLAWLGVPRLALLVPVVLVALCTVLYFQHQSTPPITPHPMLQESSAEQAGERKEARRVDGFAQNKSTEKDSLDRPSPATVRSEAVPIKKPMPEAAPVAAFKREIASDEQPLASDKADGAKRNHEAAPSKKDLETTLFKSQALRSDREQAPQPQSSAPSEIEESGGGAELSGPAPAAPRDQGLTTAETPKPDAVFDTDKNRPFRESEMAKQKEAAAAPSAPSPAEPAAPKIAVAATPMPPMSPVAAPAKPAAASSRSFAARRQQASSQWRAEPSNRNRDELKKTVREKAPAVLVEFHLEQDGSQIKIVDEDGSVYLGHLESPSITSQTGDKIVLETAPEEKSKLAVDKQTAEPAREEIISESRDRKAGDAQKIARTKEGRSATPSASFHAKGISRTLNQTVEIRGQWITVEADNSSAPQGWTTTVLPGGIEDAARKDASKTTFVKRIKAQVKINGGAEFEFIAVLVEPGTSGTEPSMEK